MVDVLEKVTASGNYTIHIEIYPSIMNELYKKFLVQVIDPTKDHVRFLQ